MNDHLQHSLFLPARRLRLPEQYPPTLTVVVDTEEEFDWSAPFSSAATSVANVQFQPLAQRIFDRYGVVPTYVIDYPVAASAEARAVLRAFAEQGRCEIGAHLHPWVNPPAGGPVDEYHSFPGNLPPALERAKLAALSKCIAEGFGWRPTTYKAGRYGIGPATEKMLVELGYRIDVSVMPHTDFSRQGGPDFTGLPAGPFTTAGGVVAIPLSVHFAGSLAPLGPQLYPILQGRVPQRLHLPGIAARLGLLERLVLSPEGSRAGDLARQARAALARGERLFMLAYHSSSLLPGANPYVRTGPDRDQFLECIDRFLSFFLLECRGQVAPVSAVAAALVSMLRESGEPQTAARAECLA